MRTTKGACLFELTTESETLCYAKLKDYFEQMYFAN